MPQRLRLRTGRLGRLLPALLDIVQLARDLVEVLGLHAFGGVEAVFRAQDIRLRDQLFLNGGVGESLPLIHLAELVQLGGDECQRPLQLLGELPLGCRRRGVERGTQLAGDTVGLAERQILGGRPLRRAIDQLLDPLRLLLDRTLRRGAAFLCAQPYARVSGGESLSDGRVERVGLRLQRRPFSLDGPPRLVRIMLLRRDALCLARQLRHPGDRALVLLAVLMPFRRAAARLLESRPQPAVLDLLRRRSGEAFPFGTRLLDLVPRVLGAGILDALAQRQTRPTQLYFPLLGCVPLGLLALVCRDPGARRLDEGAETSCGVGIELERALARHLAPFGLRSGERPLGVRNRRRGGNRFDAGDERPDALLPLLESQPLRGLRVLDRLQHRAGAPRHRLVLRARGDASQRVADVHLARLDSLLERGNPGVLVVGLERDVDELGRVGDARDGIERRLRIRGSSSDAAERLRVVHASERRRPHGVVRRRLRDG